VASDLEKLIAKHDSQPLTDEVSFATTGMIGMDYILGGGLARGRLAEFSGAESTGKSTMGLQSAVLEAQRDGRPALWLDYEFAWEPHYVADLGGTLDGSAPSGITEIRLAQPEWIEGGMELAVAALRAGLVSSVWFDSTGVMQSKEKGLATTARALAQAMPSLIRATAQAGVVCGVISQTRDIISDGFGGGWGPKKKATGGRAAKHAFSQRIEFTHLKFLKGKGRTITGDEGDSVIGRRVKAQAIKNKVAVPMRACEFDVVEGHGFARMRHLVEMAIEVGVIKKSGAWLGLAPEATGGKEVRLQGVGNMAALLEDPRAATMVAEVSRLVLAEIDVRAAYRSETEATEEDEDADADADEE
jgi:recombination protein RecA